MGPPATTATATTPSAREAFGELIERHKGIVLKVAGSYAADPEDRADLAQDIAAQLWRAWPSYSPERPVTTWMYRIALNVAISHLRGRSLRHRHHVPLDENLPQRAYSTSRPRKTTKRGNHCGCSNASSPHCRPSTAP